VQVEDLLPQSEADKIENMLLDLKVLRPSNLLYHIYADVPKSFFKVAGLLFVNIFWRIFSTPTTVFDHFIGKKFHHRQLVGILTSKKEVVTHR
jgi:hypothetical protein